MIEILTRIMTILERVRGMEELSSIAVGFFSVLLVFGVLNCLLGYRLLRFWMMLGGFGVGAGIGLFFASTLEISGSRWIYVGIMAAAGVLLGTIAFLSYKIGVFVLGAGIGAALSIYILHPTTSFIFFLCLLIGVGLGSLAVRYSREVLIVSTSLMGGVMAGFSLAKIGEMEEFPYGILMSAGFAALGMLIQFATNKPSALKESQRRQKDFPESPRQERPGKYDSEEEDLTEMEEGLKDYLDNVADEYEREDTQVYEPRRRDRRTGMVQGRNRK